jgi:hypothetical protein
MQLTCLLFFFNLLLENYKFQLPSKHINFIHCFEPHLRPIINMLIHDRVGPEGNSRFYPESLLSAGQL